MTPGSHSRSGTGAVQCVGSGPRVAPSSGGFEAFGELVLSRAAASPFSGNTILVGRHNFPIRGTTLSTSPSP